MTQIADNTRIKKEEMDSDMDDRNCWTEFFEDDQFGKLWFTKFTATKFL